MKTKILLLLVITLVVTVFVGCKKDTPTTETEKTIEDMQVPDGFTFETTQEVSLTIKMPQSLDFTDLRSRFNVYTSNPNQGGKLITAGSFDQNGEYNGTIRVPTALTEVFVSCIAGSATVSVTSTTFKEDGVIIDFGDEYGYNPPDTLEPGSGKSSEINNIVNSNRSFTSINNVIGNGDFENQ